MPDPISYRDVSWNYPDADEGAELHDRVIKHADDDYVAAHGPRTLIDAVVMGDATDVSNVCRRAKPGTMDDYFCDDRKLAESQDAMLDLAKKAGWELLKALAVK
jgi:hypothetical protein